MPKVAEGLCDAEKIFTSVSLLEEAQHGIVHGFDRADHKETARYRGARAKCFSNLSKCSILMVTSYVTTGKFPMKHLREFHLRGERRLKKSGSPKGDVFAPRRPPGGEHPRAPRPRLTIRNTPL